MSTPFIWTLLVAIISPMILSYFNNRSMANIEKVRAAIRKQEKEEDWKREKEVADQAKKAANLLLIANERVAKDTSEVKSQLKQIHILSNSNLTAAMRAQLEATIAKLVLMKTIRDRDKADKLMVDKELGKQIEKAESEVAELTETMNYRMQQTEGTEHVENAK